MKAGDLVTLSQYGRNLEACWRFWRDCGKGKMVGMIVDVSDGDYYWKGKKYKVMWLSQKHSKIKRRHWMPVGIFKRGDLKMYKTREKKDETALS